MHILNQRVVTSQNKYLLKNNYLKMGKCAIYSKIYIIMDVIVTETFGRVEEKILIKFSGWRKRTQSKI